MDLDDHNNINLIYSIGLSIIGIIILISILILKK